MKVRFSPRAQRRAKIVARWWRVNRPSAPSVFADELAAMVERLEHQPTLGLEYETVDDEPVRRVLLPRTGQHVYYGVDEENGVIIVYTIWGARRGRGPTL